MAEMTIEQQQAIALATARLRLQQQGGATTGVQDNRSAGQVAKDQIVGNLEGIPQFFKGIPGTIRDMAVIASPLVDIGNIPASQQKLHEMYQGTKDAIAPLVNDTRNLAAILMDRRSDLPQSTPDQQRGYANLAGQNATGVAIAGAKPLSKALVRAIVPESFPADLYESALKPGPRSNTRPEINRMIATALRESIPVTDAGANKLNAAVTGLNADITDRISQGAGQGVTVNKYAIASRLSPLAQQLAQQVTPEADLRVLAAKGNEFLRNQPAEIPADIAQRVKVGTYKSLGQKAYGELKGADTETQKALARGIKEELASKIPEIAKLNLTESDFLQLKPELEAALNRINNRDLIGIGTPIATGAAAAATGSAPAGILAGLIKGLIERPGVKSRLAIALSQAMKP